MKEIVFIRQNFDKWKTLEQLVDKADKEDPERLADAYMELTTDLAYSRSNYPASRITTYLNNLSSALHNYIYKHRREKTSRILDFWRTELPMALYEARHELLYALLIFLLSTLIGAFSTTEDDSFARLILGNEYVDMTLRNISDGDPMAVYGLHGEWESFFSITLNNLGVAFRCFVIGLFTCFATAIILFYNGVMVGTFQTFCFQQGVGWESLLTIWMHGTIEISAIIVAGAAGITLGNGWLFPGTYPRGYAFRRGASRGLKIAVGMAPFIIIAGFIESFLTRHTELPDALRAAFIIICFLFFLIYVAFYPHVVRRRVEAERANDLDRLA